MAKILMPEWLADMTAALRSMGIEPNNVARLAIVLEPGDVPVMHVEMIGDRRIIDLAAVLAGADDVRVSRSETPQPVVRLRLSTPGAGDDARA